MKTCNKCSKEKPYLDFHKNADSNDGYRSNCKECVKGPKALWNKENAQRHAARNKEWQEKNPERHRDIILKYKFGISLEQYNQLIKDQDGCCAICRTHGLELRRQLAVDHCHITGAIRGLLCDHCNTGIGHFKDNAGLLNKAITYLGGRGVKNKIDFD